MLFHGCRRDTQDLCTDPPQRRITLDDLTCALGRKLWAPQLSQATVLVSLMWILTCRVVCSKHIACRHLPFTADFSCWLASGGGTRVWYSCDM